LRVWVVWLPAVAPGRRGRGESRVDVRREQEAPRRAWAARRRSSWRLCGALRSKFATNADRWRGLGTAPRRRARRCRSPATARTPARSRHDSSAYLYREPGKTFVGTVFKGQPVSIIRRSASGEWARAVSDTRNEGWMKVSALCG
jgi:hypothetical protein